MGTTQEEPTLKELVSRLAALEQAHARLQEKLESSSGTAPAARPPRPGVFASDVAGTPAVSASGTNGADGVDATSDSGTGVSATSGSGTGLFATSSSGLAGHFVGNVTMDNNLNVAGALNGGAAGFASSVAGTPAVKAIGTNGVDGVDASSDSGTGVRGDSSSGTGVSGNSTSGSGVSGNSSGIGSSGIGVSGFSASGIGVVGSDGSVIVSPGIGSSIGVSGVSANGEGVSGFSTNGVGVGGSSQTMNGVQGFGAIIGVMGQSDPGTGVEGLSATGTGVAGRSGNVGVFGQSDTGTGVTASTLSGTAGVFFGNNGKGLFAQSNSGLAGDFQGNVNVIGNISVTGNFSASGTKNFVQDHPTDPSREIVYVALEGGEAGTYVRGTGQLVNGKAVLALPEHFGLVTAYEDLTIQLTPRGEWLHLYLVELDTTQAVVREAQGKSGAFDYLIHGVRRGYEQHEVIRTKR